MIHLSLALLVSIVVQLIVGGLILWLLWWLVNWIPMPEPVKKVATALIAVIAVLWLISLLLSLGGHPLIAWS